MAYKLCLISPGTRLYFKESWKNELLESTTGFDYNPVYWSGLGSALPVIASLTDDSFEIEIIDENIEQIDFNKNYDLVAITAMTSQATRAYEICQEYKKRNIHTVIGGSHVSFMYEEASKYADTVVIGEAESLWPHLLEDFKNNNIKKYYFKKDYGEINFKNLPMPRFDLLKDKNYKIIWLNTTRGCPYDCEFCSVQELFGRKITNKPIDHICNEIESIKSNFGNILIGFGADNMFIDRKYSKELLKRFIDLKFRWNAQTDITIGEDEELLELIYEAGCKMVFIGFESLSEENLRAIYKSGKKLKTDYLNKYKEMVEKIQSYGIGVFGSFIIGFDNDNLETFDNIVEFIDETNMLTAFLNVLTPLPGTRLREKMILQNRVLNTPWSNYTYRDINIKLKNINNEDFEKALLNAFKRIYSKERMKKVSNYFIKQFKNKEIK